VPEPGLRSAPDTILVGTVVGLVAIGLIMIFSASSTVAYVEHHDPTYYLKRQLLWLVVALVCAVLVYRCDYRKLRKIAPLALAVACGMLVLVLVPHIGLLSGGARRWLGGGPISFQPSEFAKLALVIYLAAALSAKGERVRSLPSGVVPLAAVTAVLTVLVLVEPDMGTASLLAFTAAAMLFAGGARRSHLLAIALVTLPPVIMLVLASPYKRARILDPWKDPQNTGFHIVQSLLALGSGGFFGLGLGMSRQKLFYLPEQFTDFIFAIIGEELGLLGAAVVVALFVVLAFRATRIALASPDRFGFFLCIGCMCLIVIQAFVNIGGSSLVVSLVAVALIVNIGRHRGLGRSEA
jgi:cell division protein FtsW